MPFSLKQRSFSNLARLMLLSIVVGCSGAAQKPATFPTWELIYFNGAPPSGAKVSFFGDGKIAMTPVGHSTMRKKLSPTDFQEILALFEQLDYAELLQQESAKGVNTHPHEGFVGLRHQGITAQRHFSSLEPTVRHLIENLDRIARKYFPEEAEIFLVPQPR